MTFATRLAAWALAVAAQFAPSLAQDDGAYQGELAISALQCAYLAPNEAEERRLLQLGHHSALEYLAFVRSGGEPDFSYEFAIALIDLKFEAMRMPSDDFAIGALYNGLSQMLYERIQWLEEQGPRSSITPRQSEFAQRNCAVLR